MQKQVSDQFDQLLAEVNEATRQLGVKVDEVGGKVDAVGAKVLKQMDSVSKRVPSPLSTMLPEKLRSEWVQCFGAQVSDISWEFFIKQIRRILGEFYKKLMSVLGRRLGIASEMPGVDERFKELAKAVILSDGRPDVKGDTFAEFFYW